MNTAVEFSDEALNKGKEEEEKFDLTNYNTSFLKKIKEVLLFVEKNRISISDLDIELENRKNKNEK